MSRPNSIASQLADLENRISALEGEVYQTSSSGSSARRYNSVVPWARKSVGLQQSLVQHDYAVTTQWQHALVFAASGSAAGALVWAWQPVYWYAPVIGGLGVGLASLTWLVLDHRSMVRSLVQDAVKPRKAKRDELRVEVVKEGVEHSGMEFLTVQGRVTIDNLQEFAAAALQGESLAVNLWAGKHDWTRPAYEALVNELGRRGFLSQARGNTGRKATAKGRALFRGICSIKGSG